jgi:lipopolysaccharide/colanic/teichoic acid biosynthesis glycosyltransferase
MTKKEVILTLHVRQPLPTAEFEKLIDQTLFAERPRFIYRDYAKRALDVALVLITAVPVLLVLFALALVIAMDGKSPIYLQKRVGRGGRVFQMWKLRSMVPNAEAQLQSYLDKNPEARAEWDRTQKLRFDPRITPIGRIIRKTSLDELPQL